MNGGFTPNEGGHFAVIRFQFFCFNIKTCNKEGPDPLVQQKAINPPLSLKACVALHGQQGPKIPIEILIPYFSNGNCCFELAIFTTRYSLVVFPFPIIAFLYKNSKNGENQKKKVLLKNIIISSNDLDGFPTQKERYSHFQVMIISVFHESRAQFASTFRDNGFVRCVICKTVSSAIIAYVAGETIPCQPPSLLRYIVRS